jgi:hypothetical protein
MTGSSKQTTTQSSVSEPWKAAQPALETGLKDAENLYKSGVGSQPYTGSTVVPFANQTMQGMNSIEGIAKANMNGRGLSGEYQALLNSGGFNSPQQSSMSGIGNFAGGGGNVSTYGIDRLRGQSMNNPAMSGYQNAAGGGLGVDTYGQRNIASQATRNPAMRDFQNFASGGGDSSNYGQRNIASAARMPSMSEQNLNDIASGGMLDREDPNFERALAAAQSRAANEINMGASSSGRYGSGVHQGNVARELGDMEATQRVNQYMRERANQVQANQLIDQQRQAGLGLSLNAANSASGIDQANQGLRFQGANAAANQYSSGLNQSLGALNSASGLEQGNRQMQMQGIGGMGSTYANSIGQALGAAGQSAGIQSGNNDRQMAALMQQFNAGQQGIGNIGTAYEGLKAPRNDLMGIGSMYEDLGGRLKNDELRIFQEQQNAPWNQIGRLNAIAAGAGSMGGTSTGTAQVPGQSPFATGLGYASTGLGLLGGAQNLGWF